MTAYVIFVCDKKPSADNHSVYRKLAPLAPSDGIKLVAGADNYEALEGATPEEVVILSFPTVDAARSWYFSPEYQEAKKHRMINSIYRAILIEG